MIVHHDGYEYTRYGDVFLRRSSASDEWESVHPDPTFQPYDQTDPRPIPLDALIEIEVQERERERRIAGGPRQRRIVIQRSPENVAIAEEFGFTGGESMSPTNASTERSPGDTLAQRLTDEKSHGTNKRVTELRFLQIAERLGMTPEELRNRFRGRFTRE